MSMLLIYAHKSLHILFGAFYSGKIQRCFLCYSFCWIFSSKKTPKRNMYHFFQFTKKIKLMGRKIIQLGLEICITSASLTTVHYILTCLHLAPITFTKKKYNRKCQYFKCGYVHKYTPISNGLRIKVVVFSNKMNVRSIF